MLWPQHMQVFEVNSSTLRSGKQILSQLEEATQSHRVAPSKSRQHPPEERVLSGECHVIYVVQCGIILIYVSLKSFRKDSFEVNLPEF